MERSLGLHVVDVPAADTLASDVAILDQLGDDPMGASSVTPTVSAMS